MRHRQRLMLSAFVCIFYASAGCTRIKRQKPLANGERLFPLVQIPLPVEQLGNEYGAAGRAAQCVMRQADELPVEQCILAQAPHRDAHPAVQVTVEFGLRAVVLFKIGDELLGCMRQRQRLVAHR